MSSSLLLLPQLFGRYVPRPSSGVWRTREPSRNFELRSLLNPRGVACSDSVSHNRVQVLTIPVLLRYFSGDWTCNLQMIVSLEASGTNARTNGVTVIGVLFCLLLKCYFQFCLICYQHCISKIEADLYDFAFSDSIIRTPIIYFFSTVYLRQHMCIDYLPNTISA